MKDFFLTIKKPSQGLYKDKGSKFISLAFPVSSEDEINSIIHSLRKEYHDARHHCFAWMIGPSGERYRSNDDGEPSGTAGKPILGQIRSRELTNILVVVIRYFGGVLLGTGGLTKAYREATADALANAEIIENYVTDTYAVSFSYENINQIYKIIEECEGKQLERLFSEKCRMTIRVRESCSQRFVETIKRIGDEGISVKKVNKP